MFSKQFIRFCIVGVTVTLTDIILFDLLHIAFGIPVVPANIISTSISLVISIALNYRYTFGGQKLGIVKIMQYVTVTLLGLWVAQPIIILLLSHPLRHVVANDVTINTVAKLGATGFTLVWNYLWYSRVIFRPEPIV